MQYSRQFWYTFFSEFGFLIMPCAFNWRSTTSWLFDAGEENEIALNDEQFKITYTGIHCFFYRINATLLKQHLPLFRLTNTLIRNKLVRDNIVLEIPPHYAAHSLPTIHRYEGKKYLEGFSLKDYITMLSAITDQIDPMGWRKDGVDTPDYLSDFDTYGLCYLAITNVAV